MHEACATPSPPSLGLTPTLVQRVVFTGVADSPIEARPDSEEFGHSPAESAGGYVDQFRPDTGVASIASLRQVHAK